MNLRSVIKNAIASRIEESKIQEVDDTPQVANTSDYIKYLAESVKFKLEEARVKVGIDPFHSDTIARMKAAGVKLKGNQPSPTPSEEPNRPISRKDALGNNKEGIFTKGTATEPATPVKITNKGNKKYTEKGKSGPATPPMTPAQINRRGVGGKPAAGRPGKTKEEVLRKKINKINTKAGGLYRNLDGEK